MSGQPVGGRSLVIEPGKFARSRNRLAGAMQVASLPRVADLLFDSGGTVRYAVSGFVNARGYSALRVELDAELSLRCQRCLGRLLQPVHTERDIVLVPGADEFSQREDEAESEDVIPDVPRLDLAPLLEEEMLLALPLAVRHEEGECRSEPTSDAHSPDPGASSPFAALAKLKR
jgi:uncharacterized protein